MLLPAGSAHANTRKRFCRLRKPEKRFGNLFGGESAWFLLSVSPLSLIWRLLLVLMLHRGRGWVFHPRGLTATSSTLTKPSETVVAGSKVPSALPANTRDVCVALGLVCACSCEQETVSSRIPAKTWNLKHGLYKYLDIGYMLEKWSLKGDGINVRVRRCKSARELPNQAETLIPACQLIPRLKHIFHHQRVTIDFRCVFATLISRRFLVTGK